MICSENLQEEKRTKATSFKRCNDFKVKPLKALRPDVPLKKRHTICFAKTFERFKKSYRVFLSLRQVSKEGKKLRPVIGR